MQENARARPLREQLAQIQLQEAQNRLAMAPLEQQLAALRLGEAQQQAAIPQFITENVDIVGGDQQLRAVNPDAPFADFQITEEFAPRQRVTRGQEVLAGGVVRPGERRETAADLQRQAASDRLAASAESRLAANQESLALYRQAQAETARMKAENDGLKARFLENNPAVGFVDVKRSDGKTYRQYFPKTDPTKIIHEVDRGEIGGDNFFNFYGRQPASASPAAPIASSIDAEVDAILSGAGKPATPAVPGPVATLTVEQARVAPAGTIFLGIDGKKRQKNANGTVTIIE
jgi:hypothetical protein